MTLTGEWRSAGAGRSVRSGRVDVGQGQKRRRRGTSGHPSSSKGRALGDLGGAETARTVTATEREQP